MSQGQPTPKPKFLAVSYFFLEGLEGKLLLEGLEGKLTLSPPTARMSKRSFGGSPAKGKAAAPPPAPPEPVAFEVDPPMPIAELKFSHGTGRSFALRELAKSCKIASGWGVWQFHDDENQWTTVHKNSTVTAPRLNCDVMEALTITRPKFTSSPHVSSFRVQDSAGNILTDADLQRVEWTPLEDLAQPEEPDTTDLLEVRVQALEHELAELKALLTSRGVLASQPSSSTL